MGWIKPRQTTAQRRPKFYLLWGESDQASENLIILVDSLLKSDSTKIHCELSQCGIEVHILKYFDIFSIKGCVCFHPCAYSYSLVGQD